MNTHYKLLLVILISSSASSSLAHSGRTDAYGGHDCSETSKRKGLCSGYHYHNNLKINETKQIYLGPHHVSERNSNEQAKTTATKTKITLLSSQ